MASTRRTVNLKTAVAVKKAADTDTPQGWFNKHLNTILTVLLVVAAVVLVVRYKINSTQAAREATAVELTQARNDVDMLRSMQFTMTNIGGQAVPSTPDNIVKDGDAIRGRVEIAVANVLNATESNDARAEATILRGDAYLALANVPELPPNPDRTIPHFADTNDVLLTKAAAAYDEVLRNPNLAYLHFWVNSARLGAAAVAENRHDWVAAKKQYDEVVTDSQAPAALQKLATIRAAKLVDLKQPIYLAKPLDLPTTGPTTGPTSQSSTLPMTTLPMTTPSTRPTTTVVK